MVWLIEMNGERESGKAVPIARHDDDDDIYIYIYIYIYIFTCVFLCMCENIQRRKYSRSFEDDFNNWNNWQR